MGILVFGIDHNSMSLSLRERLHLSESEKISLLNEIVIDEKVDGVIIINTCNRLEIYTTLITQEISDYFIEKCVNFLCKQKCFDYNTLKSKSFIFEDQKAVNHLLRLSAGLESRIVGDEQIVTQIRESLAFSRERMCVGKVLGHLFEMSIACGKDIRSQKNKPRIDVSIVDYILRKLNTYDEYFFKKKKCLVIGNGCIGKTVAEKLILLGADVTITKRNYKYGTVEIPLNCKVIPYEDRIDMLSSYDIVISTTSSPNYILKYDDLLNKNINHKIVCIDLAVPRDIEPKIDQIKTIILYNLDDFFTKDSLNNSEYKKYIDFSNNIVKKFEKDFFYWYYAKDAVTTIGQISQYTSADVRWRMTKTLNKLPESKRQMVEESVDLSINKVIHKLLFGLQDKVCNDVFFECIIALESIVDNKI